MELEDIISDNRKKKYIELKTRVVIEASIYLEGSFAVVASEAGFMVNTVISSELVNKIHSLVTGHAFLGCSCKCHPSNSLSTSLSLSLLDSGFLLKNQ